MAARGCIILLTVLIALVSAARLKKPIPTNECVDNTLYAKYICNNRPNGEKLLVPGSCSHYYQCNNGQANEIVCPNFYDPIGEQCVSTSNCVEIDNTDCVIPTPPPCTSGCTTPSPGPCGNWFDPNDIYGSFVCRDKADGTMLLTPGSCYDYYFCMGGHSYRKTCGPQRYYNPLKNACDVPSSSYCQAG